MTYRVSYLVFCVVFAGLASLPFAAAATETDAPAVVGAEESVGTPPASAPGYRTSGLPLPRFVSLKSDKVYVRTGPALRYPIRWIYKRDGLPVEVTQEFDTWRKIRDHDGDEGWVHQSLLSGARHVVVQADDAVPLRQSADQNSRVVAKLEGGVLARLNKCQPLACLIEVGGFKGWIARKSLWGIYDSDELN